MPAERSASIDICLPGIASRVKRAPTSAIRVAPLVMTMKLMVIRIRKTIRPITKSPDMTRLANPAMTPPAASWPSLPCERMTRVVAMLSAKRVMVAIRRMVGKDEKSSGFWIHSATIRINTEKAIENARPISIRKGGIGRKSTQMITMMPMAKPISRTLSPAFGRGSAGGCAISIPSLHERCGHDAHQFGSRTKWRSLREGGSEAGLDARKHQIGENRNLRPDERRGDADGDEDGHDLRNEGERCFLNLCQRLEERDDQTDHHGRRDRRAGGNENGPDRCLE
ncbi:hypothetical protein RGCCGE502_03512 [Rhizobium grahamii CCGE 502]|uniref:Uncharacterized protein n=1 Tax=Rhizobium grahamii CCGE 502 TaxID=990285 RepID=S3ILY0_9HYPH|nr:hypothetical protein RGCCGE502_03512 [Rhizobium grahamii CCGE 502]